MRVDNLEKKCDEISVEVDGLEDDHTSHDKELMRLAISVESMVKEMNKHLTEEESGRKETIKAIKTVGYQIMTAVIIGGGAFIFKTLS